MAHHSGEAQAQNPNKAQASQRQYLGSRGFFGDDGGYCNNPSALRPYLLGQPWHREGFSFDSLRKDLGIFSPRISGIPKMEGFLNLVSGYFWGWVFPYISHIHTAYMGEYLHFRYLKCLVKETTGEKKRLGLASW